MASSSRSQIAVRTAGAAVRLIWERLSVNVRQRPVMNVPIVTQLVTRPGRVGRLPGRARVAAAQAGGDLGRVAGKVLADDVQAELGQDRGGGLAFEEECERGPDELPGGNVTAPEAGAKTGWHVHLVAGARGCLDAEGATGLRGDGDLRHAVTVASRRSIRTARRDVRSSAGSARHSHASVAGVIPPAIADTCA